MEIEIKTWLYDILTAIKEIQLFIDSSPTISSFQEDLKTRRAVERNIEIIGKAMNRILAKDDSIELSNSRKIVDTRNRIIHGYDTVSNDILWNIIIEHLPTLGKQIEELLNTTPRHNA